MSYSLSKGLVYVLLLASAQVTAQDSLNVIKFISLQGNTGVYNTADATTMGKGKGSIGIFENTSDDSLDRVVFTYGIHEKLEIGIRSGIPAHDPNLNFHFKFQGTEQGNFFGWKKRFLPATAVGVNRHSTFVVASYAIRKLAASVGYNFSEGKQSAFFNVSYYPVPLITIQGEYYRNHVAGVIRFKYKKIASGFFTSVNPKRSNSSGENMYWYLAFSF
jgi:hypothetical protein